MKRMFIVAGVAGTLTLLSSSVQAVCSFSNGATSAITRTVNFGTVIVQRDTPVGTVLASANTGPYYGGQPFFLCNHAPYTHRYEMMTFRVISSYGNNVYDTNVDGVGVRVISAGGKYMPFDTLYTTPLSFYIPNFSVQLVKTKPGAVGAGVINNGGLASTSLVNWLYVAYVSLAGTNTIIPVACSVSNTSIPVPMGSVPRSTFTGPGSMGDEIKFSIPLNCDANTRVKVALDGNAHSSGVIGLLALNASPASATGLGVRLFFNNAPVTLKAPIAVGTTVSNGPYSIPLVARYYQTDARVAAGQANSTATFTLTYN